MSTTTTNLGLVKPDYTDAADIGVINSNMDKLDIKIHDIELNGGSAAIAAHNISATAHQDIRDLITSAGSGSATYFYTDGEYTVPEGVNTIYVSGCAGGASGTRCSGGGGGESCYRQAVSVVPGQKISVTIGAGGTAQIDTGRDTAISDVGQNGGDTSFGTYINLTGGKCGALVASTTNGYEPGLAGGNGATDGTMSSTFIFASTGAYCRNGGRGGDTLFGKGGSGGYVSMNVSGMAILHYFNGKAGIGYGSGGGGRGETNNSNTASSPTAYCSGAGNGANGLIIVETA